MHRIGNDTTIISTISPPRAGLLPVGADRVISTLVGNVEDQGRQPHMRSLGHGLDKLGGELQVMVKQRLVTTLREQSARVQPFSRRYHCCRGPVRWLPCICSVQLALPGHRGNADAR